MQMKKRIQKEIHEYLLMVSQRYDDIVDPNISEEQVSSLVQEILDVETSTTIENIVELFKEGLEFVLSEMSKDKSPDPIEEDSVAKLEGPTDVTPTRVPSGEATSSPPPAGMEAFSEEVEDYIPMTSTHHTEKLREMGVTRVANPHISVVGQQKEEKNRVLDLSSFEAPTPAQPSPTSSVEPVNLLPSVRSRLFRVQDLIVPYLYSRDKALAALANSVMGELALVLQNTSSEMEDPGVDFYSGREELQRALAFAVSGLYRVRDEAAKYSQHPNYQASINSIVNSVLESIPEHLTSDPEETSEGKESG